MRAVAVLFTAGPSELGIEPGSEKSLNKYLFQGEERSCGHEPGTQRGLE